jgi:hypothetical protein
LCEKYFLPAIAEGHVLAWNKTKLHFAADRKLAAATGYTLPSMTSFLFSDFFQAHTSSTSNL